MAPILEVGLPAMSVCRRYPRDIVYAPKEEGGLDIPNLYISQGTSRISFLQEHLGANTLSGELLRVTIEVAKVEVGIGRNLFSLDYKTYNGLLTDTWIKDVWKFASEKAIGINDHVTKNISLQRDNDLYLMEIFTQHSFTNAELKHINRVRLYLQVTTLSDIMCGYGTSFHQAYRIQKQNGRPNRCIWPWQSKPGQRATSLWRRALRECFPCDTENPYTLGKWRGSGHDDNWIWYYYERTQQLYERTQTNWKIWRGSTQRGVLGTTPLFRYYNEALRLPKHSKRATTLQYLKSQVRLTGWADHHTITSTITPAYYYDRSTISDSAIPSAAEEKLFAQYICEGNIQLVSDGSYNPDLQLGTASWVLESQDRGLHITGNLVTPGEEESQCSHPSELSGLLGGIHFVNKLCSKLNITEGFSKIGCDGEGAINMVSYIHDKINSSRKHFDILGAINNAILQSPVRWTFTHIRGHQDNYNKYHNLSREEQLNVLVDNLAKQKLASFATTVNWRYKRPIHIPYESCSIDWTNQFGTRVRVSCQLQKSLQKLLQGLKAREYWKKKKSLSNYYERQIDWKLLKKSHNSMDIHRHRWLSKWLTGFCGTGIMLLRYRHQTHSDCPRCGISGESASHIIQCQEQGAKSLWIKEIRSLEQWMLTNQGHPELANTICTTLCDWQTMQSTTTTQPSDGILLLATNHQQRIGWLNFIQGFFSIQWQRCQEEHFVQIKSKNRVFSGCLGCRNGSGQLFGQCGTIVTNYSMVRATGFILHLCKILMLILVQSGNGD
jgi:hypothetical protein